MIRYSHSWKQERQEREGKERRLHRLLGFLMLLVFLSCLAILAWAFFWPQPVNSMTSPTWTPTSTATATATPTPPMWLPSPLPGPTQTWTVTPEGRIPEMLTPTCTPTVTATASPVGPPCYVCKRCHGREECGTGWCNERGFCQCGTHSYCVYLPLVYHAPDAWTSERGGAER